MAFAVSAASRPYSVAVLWPTCQGPSISLPRHHTLTACGSSAPLAMRRCDHSLPPGGVAGVLDEIAGGVHAAGAEVAREHRLHAGPPAPAHELVGADPVGLDGVP